MVEPGKGTNGFFGNYMHQSQQHHGVAGQIMIRLAVIHLTSAAVDNCLASRDEQGTSIVSMNEGILYRLLDQLFRSLAHPSHRVVLDTKEVFLLRILLHPNRISAMYCIHFFVRPCERSSSSRAFQKSAFKLVRSPIWCLCLICTALRLMP